MHYITLYFLNLYYYKHLNSRNLKKKLPCLKLRWRQAKAKKPRASPAIMIGKENNV